MHDRAEQAAERAPDGVVFPPNHFGLKRLEARQGQPANGARMHSGDGRGRESRQRETIHHRLIHTRPRSSELRANGQFSPRRGTILLGGEIVAAESVVQAHGSRSFICRTGRRQGYTESGSRLRVTVLLQDVVNSVLKATALRARKRWLGLAGWGSSRRS